MKKIILFISILIIGYVSLFQSIKGILRYDPGNTNYFSDPLVKAVFLTGSHTWAKFQEFSVEGQEKFNWSGYLDMMERLSHNFMRLWVWEQSRKGLLTTDDIYIDPMPYVRTKKGNTLGGKGKFDEIQKVLEFIRKNGIPAGIGGHKVETIKGCIDYGLKPDFWMKTLHDHNYWSARPDEGNKDNNWCYKPQETIDFMESLDEPWIAYKVMAAGAITPKEGFKYAFDNGTDFICAGMYDFQIVEDANIIVKILNSDFKDSRKRRWLV